MRSAEFRNDPSLVSQWAEMLQKHELLRLVLQVMDNEHPARYNVPGDDQGNINPTMANICLGETRGYSKYGNGLLLLATPFPKPQILPETEYKKDEKDEPQGKSAA